MIQNRHYEGIVVLGMPRSGTTLLRRLLNAHSQIACPGETFLFTACARFLNSDTTGDGLDMGVLAGLGFMGFSEELVLERLREMAFSFHRENAQKNGKRRWAEKTAFDIFHLKNIERLLGKHVQFICIQRHGLDVACSLMDLTQKTGAYVSELHEYISRYPRPIEAFTHAWVDQTEQLQTFMKRHSENAILLQYESLVTDPSAECERLFEWLGEEWEPGLVERALGQEGGLGFSDWKTYSRSQIDGSSIGRWKQLSQPTLSYLAPIVNPTLTVCGYEEIEVSAGPIDNEKARRHYELGLMFRKMQKKE